MKLFPCDVGDGLNLARRADEKYAPAWEGLPPEQQAALAWYFFPHRSGKPTVSPTRPRVVKWYCPFADQRQFPSGHRYCINVYTGCGHQCTYCYAAGYEPKQPACKKGFERGLLRDLADLDEFDVPPAPLHLSNSTDAFQPMEAEAAQTKLVLQHIGRYRHRFTTITVLTKNPLLAAQPEYVMLLRRLARLPGNHPRARQFADANLPSLRVEVSLAFARDEVRQVFEPGAPSVEDRMEGIRRLRAAGIPIVLRIDPLVPRSPLRDKTCDDFCLPDAQPLCDLNALLDFAEEARAMHVVYSVAKITRPRGVELTTTMGKLLKTYRFLAEPAALEFRGGSWRLPWNIAQEHVVEPFLRLCKRHGLAAKFCKQNLLTTP